MPCFAAQTIETRTALLKPLAALAGRLDLLVAHLPKDPSSGAAAEQPALGGPQACSYFAVAPAFSMHRVLDFFLRVYWVQPISFRH